jgi:tight adherence protein C
VSLLLAGLAAAAAFALARHGAALRPVLPGRRRASPGAFAALPDFLELLALALSCGHPLSAAWPSAAEHMPPGPFRRDVSAAAAALAYGRPAEVCMTELADRIGDARAAMALALVAQAMVMGNALEPALLSQAASLRRLRLSDIERRAQTAPLRMMLPVMGLILPAVMIVLLGPIVLRLKTAGGFF